MWKVPFLGSFQNCVSGDNLQSLSCLVIQLLSHDQLFVTPGLQHPRLPCPSLSPRFCSNSCPLNQWCHPTISWMDGEDTCFSSCPPSFPASGSFPMSQFFTSGGQSIGASASASVLPMTIQDWFPLGWTDLISFSSRDSQESSPKPHFKSINSSAFSLLYGQLSHPYMTTGKTIALTICTFFGKVMSLLFNSVYIYYSFSSKE